MPQEDDSSLVTLFDTNDENVKNLRNWKTVSQKHPCTLEESDFMLLTTNDDKHHIYEVQSIETKYGSYFLGSHVLNHGALYVATRMDPLYFVLSTLSSAKWQPLDQLEIPDTIKTLITDDKQYRHLCLVNNQLGDDMLLYKLSNERVLQWLTRKQERVHQVLRDEALARRVAEPYMSTKSDGFHLLEGDCHVPSSTPQETLELSVLEQSRLHHHSIQVVCEYISPEWRTQWLDHLGQPESCILAVEDKKVPKRTWEEAGMNVVSVEKKKNPAAQSVGLKRLQKVSTKGMKSLSNFFGAKNK
jgi:Ydr279p protein family (RNase H2 complex component) wHTH domain